MSLTPDERQRLIELFQSGEEIDPEWARILFPPEKREYELVCHGKDREEDIIADTLAVPLQLVKTLSELKKRGDLCSADGTPGQSSRVSLHRILSQ